MVEIMKFRVVLFETYGFFDYECSHMNAFGRFLNWPRFRLTGGCSGWVFYFNLLGLIFVVILGKSGF